MTGLTELHCVVLTRDVPAHWLWAGDLGTVVAVSAPDTLEGEFIRASRRTQALVTLKAKDVRPVGAEDIVAVRALEG